MPFPSDADAPETPEDQAHETPLHDADEYNYPTLALVLSTYFTKSHRDVLFYEEYAEYGEDSSRFNGLQDDLAAAIRSPNKASQDLHKALDLPEGTLTPAEVRSELMDVYDKITNSGRYSLTAIRQAEAERVERMRQDPEEMFNSYAKRNVNLPGWLGGRQVPLWGVTAFGAVLMALSLAVKQINLTFFAWLASALSAAGILIFAFGAVSMFFLRGAVKRARSADDADDDSTEGSGAQKKGKWFFRS